MIASLSGLVQHLSGEVAVIEVGGVGLAVQCGAPAVRQMHLGQRVVLATSLVVREDSLTLYGFLEADARDIFETVQSVSGVGPRVALAMLTALSPDQLRAAVHSGDEKTLMRVPGIGRKGAQRIVLELADKLTPPVGLPAPAAQPQAASAGLVPWQQPVRDALVSLGWSAREADEAVALVVEQDAHAPDADVSTMLAFTLRIMGRR